MPANLHQHRLGVLRMLLARIDLINTSIGHNLTQGEENETVVRNLLTDVLPSEYGIGSGVIVGVDGRASKQIDVIVFDRTRANMTLGQESRLFFADQVLLVIEVKTTFSSGRESSLQAALENIASVKCLQVAPQKWVEGRSNPATGNWEITTYEPRPPVGVIFFFGTPETVGPLDLDSFFRVLKSAVDGVALEHQPDMVLSLGHSSFFRHTDIGNHMLEGQEYSTAIVQSATEAKEVLVLPASVGPLRSVIDISGAALSPGVLDAVEVTNVKGTSKAYVLRGDAVRDEVTSYRVARIGTSHYLLDRARAFLLFVEGIERLLRLKRPNPIWSGNDYFGAEWSASSKYPSDFDSIDASDARSKDNGLAG